MHPTTFNEQYSKPLGAGDNPNTGDLNFCRAISPETPGPCFLISCWCPTPDELKKIIETGQVYVAVMANPNNPTQPPIAVMGHNPFTGYDNPYIRIEEGDLIPGSEAWVEREVVNALKDEKDPHELESLAGINHQYIDVVINRVMAKAGSVTDRCSSNPCVYSRSMSQTYPRKCIHCGNPETTTTGVG